ncbi:hypothetical protein Ae505Ps2_1455c [Pseudonocardia sp. Ae505_Ps2]|nr:hypothetical protein Ae505Ps2_1455c [Pseudonocardia sp. Ae505_Ps2]
MEHRADGRVPTGAEPPARGAHAVAPRCRLSVTSATAGRAHVPRGRFSVVVLLERNRSWCASDRSSPGLDAPAQKVQQRCEIAVCRWASDTGTRWCAPCVPASPETRPPPGSLGGPPGMPARHRCDGPCCTPASAVPGWAGRIHPLGDSVTVMRAAWQLDATHGSPGERDRAPRRVDDDPSGARREGHRAGGAPSVDATVTDAAVLRVPLRATGPVARRARPMFHGKPHGCGSTWNIAQPCRAAARSTSAR